MLKQGVMDELSDEHLMQKYGSGDASAFEQLYLRHKNSLYRYLLRQSTEPQIAEEIYQDVWHKVITARLTYQASAQFNTWLYHLARNALIDHFRRSATAHKYVVEDDGSHNHAESDLVDNEQAIDTTKQLMLLKHCLQQLPQSQQEAFLLKHEVGLSLNAIAEVVGEQEQSIKSRLRYALNKLKYCMQAKLGGNHG
ncbi:sigma-70 family RNA polymerase sigma factor [Pseudoalteromonas tunicata]|uniref:sigma-70 family RNA polymerase sigma factor n=1 Tax=Pseudoalteromonas tunicata TaxID=314281 RepID=UPI00273DB9D8|nr:sigma-70 family RNA polymerase sigma factor [Pseudoalteromonas tunicata]MDP5214667.1 sigma-70 family RNA polymerase sigma factor [Pseudoalteromonas tunicata]